MIVAQVKGSNGSGKTSTVKSLLSMMDTLEDVRHLWHDGKVYATVNPTIGWAAVGKYEDAKAMGGCDLMKTGDEVRSSIIRLVNYCDNAVGESYFGIVFEGMIISVSKNPYYEFLLGLKKSMDITPLFVILHTTLEGCVNRIEKRRLESVKPNTRPLNKESVREKCVAIERHAKSYDQRYVRWIDVETVLVEDMLVQFLMAVGDQELVGYVKSGSWL